MKPNSWKPVIVCLLCGRDKFARTGPHICGKQYRKRGLKWLIIRSGAV